MQTLCRILKCRGVFPVGAQALQGEESENFLAETLVKSISFLELRKPYPASQTAYFAKKVTHPRNFWKSLWFACFAPKNDTRALVSLSLEMHDKKSSEKLFLLSGDAAQQYLQHHWSKDQSTTVLVKGPSCNNSPPLRIEYVSLNETMVAYTDNNWINREPYKQNPSIQQKDSKI